MENISRNELQALLDQLVGKEWSKDKTMYDLRQILNSNENYANKVKIVDSSVYANYFEVCEKETTARFFSVEIKRKKGDKHWGWVDSYCDWTIKEVIITNYNENVQADIDKIRQYEEKRKQEKREEEEMAKKVINFLKEQGYDYWKRRQIINNASRLDGYNFDKEQQ